MTYTFPQPSFHNRGVFRKTWSRLRKFFPRTHGRARSSIEDLALVALAHAVNTKRRSIVGFFGRRLLGLPGYCATYNVSRSCWLLADIWRASTADTRKPSCMPTTRRLYTNRRVTDAIVVGTARGSGSRYFEISAAKRESQRARDIRASIYTHARDA